MSYRSGDCNLWNQDDRVIRRLERDGQLQDMMFMRARFDGSQRPSRIRSYQRGATSWPGGRQRASRAQYRHVPCEVPQSPRSRSFYLHSPRRSPFYLHSPNRPFFLHGARRSPSLIGAEARFSLSEPRRSSFTRGGTLPRLSPSMHSPRRRSFYLHSPRRSSYGARRSPSLIGAGARFSPSEPSSRYARMGARPKTRPCFRRTRSSSDLSADSLNDTVNFYNSLFPELSPCRRPRTSSLSRSFADAMDIRTRKVLPGSPSFRDSLDETLDYSDSDSDSYDSLDYIEGEPSGYWSDPEVFYGPEKKDATMDLDYGSVFYNNPICADGTFAMPDDGTFDVGPGADQTVELGPGLARTFQVDPGFAQTFEMGPGSDQTVDMGPGFDQTVDIGPGLAQTFHVSPGFDQTIEVGPSMDRSFGLSPISLHPCSPQRPFFLHHGPLRSSPVGGYVSPFHSWGSPGGAAATRRRSPFSINRVTRWPSYLQSPPRPFFLHGSQTMSSYGSEEPLAPMPRPFSPCRRVPSLERSLADVTDASMSRRRFRDSLEDMSDYSDLYSDDSFDSLDYTEGVPSGYWSDAEVFYGPEKMDATLDLDYGSVFYNNPIVRDGTFELGDDGTFELGNDGTFDAGPGAEQTFEVCPGADQTFEL